MSPRRWSPALAALLAAIWSASAPTKADCQEIICDPENPACEPSETSSGDDRPENQSAEETIFDPENPATTAEATENELVSEPSLIEEEIAPGPSESFNTVRFLGGWGTRLDVDSAFDAPGEDIVELSSYLDLGLEWDPRSDFRVVLNGEFRHWAGGKENPDNTDLLLNAQQVRAAYEARLGEAYALWRSDNFTIGVGNLVTRWGSTDLTRPGDVLNPQDQTTINALEAAERLPQLTLDLGWTGDGWALQGLVVPFFVPNRVWAFGRDTSLLNSRNPVVRDQFPIDGLLTELVDRSIQDDVQPLVNATRVPDEVPANVSLGARATATFLNTDVGVGWWRGWDRTPFIYADEDFRTLINTVLADGQVLEDFDFLAFFLRNPELVDVTESLSEKAQAGEELFFSEYRRMQMLLIDGARYIGPIGVRADVAFFPQRTYVTESFQAVRRPTFAPALGLSWERLVDENDAITLTVEGFANIPLAADSPLTESLVDDEVRGSSDDALLIVGDGIYGIASAFVWAVPWVESRLQLGGVYNVSHGDVVATASISRTFFDWMTISAGYTMFEGPPPEERLTLGGIYDANDQVSIGLTGVF